MACNPDFQTVLTRRKLLKGAAALMAASALPLPVLAKKPAAAALAFNEIPAGIDGMLHVSPGHAAQVLLRWGDAVLRGAPAFDPQALNAKAQEQQFGYNNDHIQYLPLDPLNPSQRGLLCVNHEFALPELMFPGEVDEEAMRVEMAAHGVSVVEVMRDGQGWKPVLGRYNRRISATTPMRLSGPAAYSPRLRTAADDEGNRVLGTFANCAGGMTPWGTYLTCEENIDGYFNLNDYDGPERANHEAMTIGKKRYYQWERIDPRFDVKAEPHEPNRFGWVVEIDPLDSEALPVKRTALGRFKHEGATCVLNRDRRVVVYSGDDQVFQYIYRYVSHDPYDPGRKSHNRALLDNGVLAAARFHEDGSVEWLPLIWGEGPLVPENGFVAQADVLIEARRAATLLGATPMDRPEDIDINPLTGRVYASLTKNRERALTDHVNRRAPNPTGYILEMIPPKGDHAAARFEWEIFLEGNEHLACPDNLAFDKKGRLWIATDGQEEAVGSADALYATPCEGEGRAAPRRFARGPQGCEITGPCFTPDNRTLFVSVQHPAQGSRFDRPATRWPDFDASLPPRPAIVAITREDGGVVGG